MSAANSSIEEPTPKEISGRHVLLGFVIFFGVMFAANGVLVYYALSTFSGGDRPDPYRSGLAYNETIAEADRQAALGWNASVDYDSTADRLTLRFSDKAGLPVSGLNLSAILVRPVENLTDRPLAFREWAEGVYVSDAQIDPGNWVLSVVSLGRDGVPVYRLKRRLVVANGS